MEKLEILRDSSPIKEYKPSAIVALAASLDGLKVAAAREDVSLELWLVSPGAVGWHCQLTIQGNSSSRISSLVWWGSRLLSSSIDGMISEWDLFSLQQKIVVQSVGVSIWQMAIEPNDCKNSGKIDPQQLANGHANHEADSDCESSYSEDGYDSDEVNAVDTRKNCLRLAVACDDGCIRIYDASDSDGLNYSRTFPRVSGRILSVAWSPDAKLLFSGSSDGIIRCWDTKLFHETYRITVGLGGLGSGPEICIWSLLFLRCGTLVSGDSTGSVQFWDSYHGTLLQAHTYHKGDVNALATDPSHKRVFSAGSDGQVILYKAANDAFSSVKEELPPQNLNKWVYVGYKRVHSHDVRALTVAMPISSEDTFPDEKVHKIRNREKPINFSYHKWAHSGIPMLISGGDDTKLFAYSAKEFTMFDPHDVCPAPQRVSMQLVQNTATDGASMMLAQYSGWLDIKLVGTNHASRGMPLRKSSCTEYLRVKAKESRKIISSCISSTGMLVAYSDHVKPCLFELKRHKAKAGNIVWSVNKLQLPRGLQFAHSMVFSVGSSQLMLAGHDRKIYVVDVRKCELVHTFVPQRKDGNPGNLSSEPSITRMFTSADGQWLAAINCFGDIYVFNLETYRQHWFIARLNGASVTSGGFPPKNSNVLVVTTSTNQVYVFDVEAKQLGEWSKLHTLHLPRKFQEFPGEVIGLSFPPTNATSVIVYSARAMCLIDFGMPFDLDEDIQLPNGLSLEKFYSPKSLKTKKRKAFNLEFKSLKNKNFDFYAFKDPALFVGHLSESSVLVIEKPWMQVLQKFDAPVHRHLFGT